MSSPYPLKGSENSNIKRLELVGGVRREAEQMDPTFTSEFNHPNCSMGIVAIKEDNDRIIGISVFLKLGYDRDPEVFETEINVSPPIWRGCNPM
jgi:hypothetical protein